MYLGEYIDMKPDGPIAAEMAEPPTTNRGKLAHPWRVTATRSVFLVNVSRSLSFWIAVH